MGRVQDGGSWKGSLVSLVFDESYNVINNNNNNKSQDIHNNS